MRINIFGLKTLESAFEEIRDDVLIKRGDMVVKTISPNYFEDVFELIPENIEYESELVVLLHELDKRFEERGNGIITLPLSEAIACMGHFMEMLQTISYSSRNIVMTSSSTNDYIYDMFSKYIFMYLDWLKQIWIKKRNLKGGEDEGFFFLYFFIKL